ncbi:peptidoglycan-associated lipoprotein Pal [Phenylobacterium sp.]|uniref:peptidoglycan-associated lipoprotein Pal n=1 Tax=Phenylobacterium sp. TaxID=1871053 RepID=UPI00273006CF|nr:peptidoglycan-associated lipoprotein Pal [Phenylobacterium sp.]MDP1618296.1 peptidoglycan-associated lipoprotein Pal [Phenylobacterium sp.]MDP1987218.1 peptidoglycan-associated lipoprotein Pal [Phenylobacterium sp.]
MTTSTMTKRAAKFAIIALAAASLTACASRPKPEAVGPTPPPPPPPASQPGTPPPPVSQGALPGTQQDFVINVGDRVYFDFDSYSVRGDAAQILEAQAAWLNRYPAVMIRIEGNADERGTREYNLALGARRANAVRDFLVARGVSSSRINTVSYGKERPIDPGTSEDAYQRNRNAHTAITSGAN